MYSSFRYLLSADPEFFSAQFGLMLGMHRNNSRNQLQGRPRSYTPSPPVHRHEPKYDDDVDEVEDSAPQESTVASRVHPLDRDAMFTSEPTAELVPYGNGPAGSPHVDVDVDAGAEGTYYPPSGPRSPTPRPEEPPMSSPMSSPIPIPSPDQDPHSSVESGAIYEGSYFVGDGKRPKYDDREETIGRYQRGGFHPVHIGETFDERYRVVRKLGYGQYATVWLVRDLLWAPGDDVHSKFLAMKVLSARYHQAEDAIYEREILQHLRSADPNHAGYPYICHLVDDFEHEGPNGRHICLVFELMGETLHTFGGWFENGHIPTELMKSITVQLLIALKYAHDQGVIHTDIKQDNIFVRFQDYSRIEETYLSETPEDRVREDEPYRIILSRPLSDYYLAHYDSLYSARIALGDWGIATWADNHLTEDIQPTALRSPEVLLGAQWDETTDIWNLGAILLEVFRDTRMFYPYDAERYHSTPHHLHQMSFFFGPFPKRLTDRGSRDLVRRWLDADGNVRPVAGKKFSHVTPLSHDRWMGSLGEPDRGRFLHFLYAMMQLDPDDRLPLEELLRHPWIGIYAPPRNMRGVQNYVRE